MRIKLHNLFFLVLGVVELAAANVRAEENMLCGNWDEIDYFSLKSGLKAYWDVSDATKGENLRCAIKHGFSPITRINTYADYPGTQRENIYKQIDRRNPYSKPEFFERIIRRNISMTANTGVFVHDIEFDFEQDAEKSVVYPLSDSILEASSLRGFKEEYLREWASWYYLPLKWTEEIYPKDLVGVYGVQAFRRDYWGVAGKTSQQIDAGHQIDEIFWKYIDPFVDVYVASIYVFYDDPGSIFYMASNVEENYIRTRKFGGKPVYAYEWLRFHNSNLLKGGRELPPYLVEAMAIIPYFSGATGVVLWGAEPQLKSVDSQLYQNLSIFTRSLQRVARVSEMLGGAKLMLDESAHEIWNRKDPLVRRFVLKNNSCVIMAINPWQQESDVSSVEVPCGEKKVSVRMKDQHVTIIHSGVGGLVEY